MSGKETNSGLRPRKLFWEMVASRKKARGGGIARTQGDLSGVALFYLNLHIQNIFFPFSIVGIKNHRAGFKKAQAIEHFLWSASNRNRRTEVPSLIKSSRRITLSLVLVLPLMLIFPKWATSPFSKGNSTITLSSPGTTCRVLKTLAKA